MGERLVDLSIALSGCTSQDSMPVMRAIARLADECGAAVEFLLLGEHGEEPGDVPALGSCPLRSVPASQPGYGPQLRAARDPCRGTDRPRLRATVDLVPEPHEPLAAGQPDHPRWD